LRIAILGPFLLDDFIGDEAVKRGVATFEDLLIGVDLADLLLDVVQNHPFLHLLALKHQITALCHVQLKLLHCGHLHIHALLRLI
jgi:hypothetical protein